MTYDPKGPTAKAWAAREKLLKLPRAHTPAERTRLKRLEAHLIREGVLTLSTTF